MVEPRLGKYDLTDAVSEDASLSAISAEQKKGLRNAGIAALVFVAFIVACCIPKDSFFRNADGQLLGSTPLVDSLIVLIALLFFIPGTAYGLTVKTFKGNKDVSEAMVKSMGSMASFMALAFVSAQFIKYFE
ncbi:MAG: AbgT family transporter, partial [Paraprevotella sp.]|nr:AbgT family transporter [Paraprevotella sp.]